MRTLCLPADKASIAQAAQLLREKLDEKNVYYMNPALLS